MILYSKFSVAIGCCKGKKMHSWLSTASIHIYRWRPLVSFIKLCCLNYKIKYFDCLYMISSYVQLKHLIIYCDSYCEWQPREWKWRFRKRLNMACYSVWFHDKIAPCSAVLTHEHWKVQKGLFLIQNTSIAVFTSIYLSTNFWSGQLKSWSNTTSILTENFSCDQYK